MEKQEVKRQNNRKDDIKRNENSDHDVPSKEKEWDPNRRVVKHSDLNYDEKSEGQKKVQQKTKDNK